jgi:hypothetical protein
VLFFLCFLAFSHSFFFALLRAFLLRACERKPQKRHPRLPLVATEPDRNGISSGIYRKTATPCCDDVTSIQDQVPRKSYFLQGPSYYGQQSLCLALCILFSLYG